jgi:two-component system response regulator MprA
MSATMAGAGERRTGDVDTLERQVLIADDDTALLNALAALVSLEGWQAVTATDGLEALVLAREKRPDLILMDLVMPRLDGITAIQLIREEPGIRHIPIIAITGHDIRVERPRPGVSGVVAIFSKPFSLRELRETLRMILDSLPEDHPAPRPVSQPPRERKRTAGTNKRSTIEKLIRFFGGKPRQSR